MKSWAAALLMITLSSGLAYRPDFENIAASAGIKDSFPNGGTVTKEYIIETTGSGIAFIDYDNDGLPDLFVLSGQGGTNRMYHNEGQAALPRDHRSAGPYLIRLGARCVFRRFR